MDRFDEAYQTVRGEMRYFAMYATEHGVIETVITRSEDNSKPQYTYSTVKNGGRQAGATDYKADARLFVPDKEYQWKWIAGLIYSECEGRDVPMHGELRDHHLEALRADSDKLVNRTVAILTAHAQAGVAAA